MAAVMKMNTVLVEKMCAEGAAPLENGRYFHIFSFTGFHDRLPNLYLQRCCGHVLWENGPVKEYIC